MVKEIRYTSIRRVLEDLIEDAHMENLTLEQVVRHAIRFIGKHGFPRFYQDKVIDLDIHEFRGLLPCDLISIQQVKDIKSGICMRAMTDNFPEGMLNPDSNERRLHPERVGLNVMRPELSFKTQGRIIYTNFPEGQIQIAYKSIPLDEDGFPLLIDNENYLDALEAYIAMKVLRNKFRQGKVPAAVYQDAQQEYGFAAASLQVEFNTPSVSEMQSITNMFNSLIPRVSEFYNGFQNLGDREYIRRH